MPTPYNKDFTRRKSNVLHDLDCRTTGPIRHAGQEGPPYTAVFTADEAIEAGECISMVRVPRGFTVTDVLLTWSNAGQDGTIGVGDPFACGRFLGPLLVNKASGHAIIGTPQGTFTCAQLARLAKIGRSGDGCGFGYTYTCETDIIVTNGYGEASFNQGGSSAPSLTSGGGYAGPLPSGIVIGLRVEGYINPAFTNPT